MSDLMDLNYEFLRLRQEHTSLRNVHNEVCDKFEEQVKEIERLREALEDIAFGRIEGDYSDVRYYARQVIDPT